MRVALGSTAPPKIEAVREVLCKYRRFDGCIIDAIDVRSLVSSHPMNPQEILQGANNRALAAYGGCDYGIGIEDGSIEWPGTRTGLFTLSLCAIYDGREFVHGISCGFESPLVVTALIKEGVELSDAWKRANLYEGMKLGYGQGSIGILTGGHMPRKLQIMQGVEMALIHLENAQLYGR